MSKKGGSSTQHSSFGLGTATGVGSTRRSALERLPPSLMNSAHFCYNTAAAHSLCSIVEILRVGGVHRSAVASLSFLSFLCSLSIPIARGLRAYITIPRTLAFCSPTLRATLLLSISVSCRISRPFPLSPEPRCHLLYACAQHVLHNFHYSARHGMNRCIFRHHLGLCLVFNCLS